MQNFVGVRVADAAENMRVGKRSLQRMIGCSQSPGKRIEARVEWFDTAGTQRLKARFALDHAKRRAPLRPRFGQPQPAVVEFEGDQDISAAEFGRGSFPMQATCDHEM